jgi:hypothetical protein
MVDRYFNPFQGIDVSVPVEFHDDITRYSQREGRPILDQSPFPRMVDMWLLAVCVAARAGLEPADIAKYETRKIIEGSIFSSDPWRVHTLMLVAIAQADNVDIVAEPRKMMAIANGLAIAGLPKVIEMLKGGGGDPIWNLSEAVEELVKPRRVAA